MSRGRALAATLFENFASLAQLHRRFIQSGGEGATSQERIVLFPTKVGLAWLVVRGAPSEQTTHGHLRRRLSTGVRLYLNVHPERLNYMLNRRVTFDMGAWIQDPSPLLPYAIQTVPAVVMALEPDRWLLQLQSAVYMRFDHGLAEVMDTNLLTDGNHLILPALDTPIQDTTSLSNVDFSKCFVEVDVVEMSMSGKEQCHTLAVVPFQPQKYGQTWSDLRTSPDAF